MRFAGLPALIAFCALGWWMGCSSEEPPPPQKPEVVRKSISVPPAPAQKAASGGAQKRKQTTAPGLEEPRTPAAAVSEAAPKIEEAPGVKSPQGTPVSGATPETAETASRETRPQEADAQETAPVKEEPAAVEAPTEDAGYTVRPGDSLAVVAGREDVFGDPLKWPILYQLNRERLKSIPLDARLPERRLPVGVPLRTSLSGEEQARTGPGSERTWVVNVISSPTADRIDGPAARLLKQGYPVYISRATVKGQKWMRLRVGFFEDRPSAVQAGRELQEVLGQEDSWPVRIGPEERAGYADILIPLHEEGRHSG